MKKIVFNLISLGFIILLGSCNGYKAINSDPSKFHFERKLFFNDETMENVDVNFNGINYNLLFNTGILTTSINGETFDLKKERIIKRKNIYGPDKKILSTSTTYVVDSVKSNLYSAKNKYITISNIENRANCSKIRNNGILGSFFSEAQNEIELNYENGFIQISDKPIDKTRYTRLESKINSSGMLYVKMEVNGIRDFFLFDTGNKSELFINKEVYKVLPKKVEAFSTIDFGTNNRITKDRLDIYQSIFKLSRNLSFNQYVCVDNALKKSILNLEFIKKFNWIIDSKNNKVYCKPIDLKKLNSVYKIPQKTELTNVIGDKIIVIRSVENKSKYNIGDKIISINNQRVSSENICEMQDLLTKTNDWSILNLEILSSTE